jgi:hypothetical protein
MHTTRGASQCTMQTQTRTTPPGYRSRSPVAPGNRVFVGRRSRIAVDISRMRLEATVYI